MALARTLKQRYVESNSLKNVLFLSRSKKHVSIGRHQNCWSECNFEAMRQDKVNVVRRDSGGGACFVDEGNLLFSIIGRQSPSDNYHFLIDALTTLGIQATMKGRNDIVVDGKKVSGSAFTLDQGVYKHHGTLLHSVNMHQLTKYLSPHPLKLQSHATQSVRSRVVNLVDIKQGLTMNMLEEAVIHAFKRSLSYETVSVEKLHDHHPMAHTQAYRENVQFFTNPSYVFNANPAFTLQLDEKFSFGMYTFHFAIDQGVIQQCHIFTDDLEIDHVGEIGHLFVDKPFNITTIIEVYRQVQQSVDKWTIILTWLSLKI